MTKQLTEIFIQYVKYHENVCHLCIGSKSLIDSMQVRIYVHTLINCTIRSNGLIILSVLEIRIRNWLVSH